MNYTELNATIVPPFVVVHQSIIVYLIVCIMILFTVGMCLFGAIRKTNPLYLYCRWISLKFALCCCREKHAEKVERDSKVLADLLADIENTSH